MDIERVSAESGKDMKEPPEEDVHVASSWESSTCETQLTEQSLRSEEEVPTHLATEPQQTLVQCNTCQREVCDPDPYAHEAFGRTSGPTMSHQVPLIPKASAIYVHSGNIINWNGLKRKPNHSSTDELCEILSNSLRKYFAESDKNQLQYLTEVYHVNSENIQSIGSTSADNSQSQEESERGELKITAKIFICQNQSPGVIAASVDKVLKELDTTFIENLLLAVAPSVTQEEESEQIVSLNVLRPYWQAMEDLVRQERVLSLGICDLNKDALEDLFNWAAIKPCINQVNLESCCVIPKDLTEYAKSVHIQLLTHNDSAEFITSERLQDIISETATQVDSESWQPQWVVRYSGILKCRGIIKMKGYIFHAFRENGKQLC